MSKETNNQKQSEKTEKTIVWATKVTPIQQGNLLFFPSDQESIVQEKLIPAQEGVVKLKIISSGFSKVTHSSPRMQLAA